MPTGAALQRHLGRECHATQTRAPSLLFALDRPVYVGSARFRRAVVLGLLELIRGQLGSLPRSHDVLVRVSRLGPATDSHSALVIDGGISVADSSEVKGVMEGSAHYIDLARIDVTPGPTELSTFSRRAAQLMVCARCQRHRIQYAVDRFVCRYHENAHQPVSGLQATGSSFYRSNCLWRSSPPDVVNGDDECDESSATRLHPERISAVWIDELERVVPYIRVAVPPLRIDEVLADRQCRIDRGKPPNIRPVVAGAEVGACVRGVGAASRYGRGSGFLRGWRTDEGRRGGRKGRAEKEPDRGRRAAG